MRSAASVRRGQRGRATGCVLLIFAVLVVVCAGAFIAGRALANPELGAPPQGPDHGSTPEQLAAYLVSSLAATLATEPNAQVTLSEHDLTVIAVALNPDPIHFRNPEVLVRNGGLVVAASTPLGPLTVTASADVQLALVGVSSGAPHIASTVTGFELGREWIPMWLRTAFDSRGDAALSLDTVLNDDPALQQLRPLMECLSVTATGVTLGFHRPGLSADAAECAAA